MELTHMTGTYVWMGIFFVAAGFFWGTALWAIFRGGKDVLEIIFVEKPAHGMKNSAPNTRV